MPLSDHKPTSSTKPERLGCNALVRRLIEAREALRWTQDDLARVAGLQCTAISHFETGGRTPSLPNFIKLAKALRVSSDWLLGLSDDVKGVEVIVNGERYVRSPNAKVSHGYADKNL